MLKKRLRWKQSPLAPMIIVSRNFLTLYSAETAESRNYTSPTEGKFQQVGQSQSCVIYSRSEIVQRNSVVGGKLLEKQRSFIHGRKMYSLVAASQRSNDYFSPTVTPARCCSFFSKMDVLIDSWKAWYHKEVNNKIIVFPIGLITKLRVGLILIRRVVSVRRVILWRTTIVITIVV